MLDLQDKFSTPLTRDDMLNQRLKNILEESDNILIYAERRSRKLVESIFEDDMFSAQEFADAMGGDAYKLIQALEITNDYLKTLKPEMKGVELPSTKNVLINDD